MLPTTLLVLLLTIMIVIYAYLYKMLPNLHEHFVNVSNQEKEIKRVYAKLHKKYRKNLNEEREVKQELIKLKRNLRHNVKQKDILINKTNLIEYDIEKAKASYNKSRAEVAAIISYQQSLQKAYIRVGKDLDDLKESHALDKMKCSLIDTNLLKSRRSHETLTKEVQSAMYQIDQLKKQSEILIEKKDPLAKTLIKVLETRRSDKATLDMKLAETSAKLQNEMKQQEMLKSKLSLDEDKLIKLKKQHDLDERQLVSTEAKYKQAAAAKKNHEIELKQIKESISIRNNMNRNLQGDINKIRKRYNKTIQAKESTTTKINAARAKTLNESMEIKKLQTRIEDLKKESARKDELYRKQKARKPCSLPVSYLPLTEDEKDRGTNPQDSKGLGSIEFKTVEGRKCAYFNNKMDTYIKLPNAVRGSFTVSFWFLVKSNGYYTMVSRSDETLKDPLVQFDIALPGKLNGPYLGLPKRWTGFTNKTHLELNRWYNVTLVVNGQVAETYINGIKEGSANGTSPMPDRPYWIIGRSGDNGRAADVCIAHFSLWNHTLSETEIELYYKETMGDTLPETCPSQKRI